VTDNKLEIALVASSTLEGTGLKKLITECGITASFYEYTNTHELFEFLVNKSPHYIFVHSHKCTGTCNQMLQQYLHKSSGIKLVKMYTHSEAKPDSPLHLNIEEPESTILKNIVRIFEPVQEVARLVQTTGLSQREIDVLKQVALGLTNKEISDLLNISMHTVITHRKNITAKLGIKTIAGLTVYAVLNNIIHPEEVEN